MVFYRSTMFSRENNEKLKTNVFSTDIIEKLHEWELIENSIAPLSAYQRSICLDLAEETSERLFSSSFSGTCEDTENLLQGEHFPIRTSAQFFNWYSAIDNKWIDIADSEYELYLISLKKEYKKRNNLLFQVENMMKEIDEFKLVSKDIFDKTISVHESGIKLLTKQEKLKDICNEIDSRLDMFYKSNSLVVKEELSSFVNSEPFFKLLNDIDECLDYFKAHETYLESNSHAMQMRFVLNKVLSSLKRHVLNILDTCKSYEEDTTKSSELGHPSKFVDHYGRFHGVAARLKPVIIELENRLEKSSEYDTVLMDIQRAYISLRNSIIQPSLQVTITNLVPSKVGDYCSLLRSMTTLLVHLSQDEDKLYYQFFSKPSQIFTSYMESVCSVMYDNMRPLVIHIKHLETLAEICSILRVEILQDRVKSNSLTLEPFGKVTEELLQDVQERLVFRAHLYFKTDILEFRPSLGDLAYPEMLEMMKNISEEIRVQEASSLSRCESRLSLTSISSVGDSLRSSMSRYSKAPSSNSSTADLQGMWYPAVRRTLVCLSRLYRCVEKPIFQGLAQEAIVCCTENVTMAARMILANKTNIDSYLFEIRHLLILREQIAPFQVDFTVQETTLDFQNLKAAAYSLLQRDNKTFSFKCSNVLLEFILHGSPLLRENCLDSRKIVDKQLKNTCESFIAHITEHVMGPIRSFLDNVQKYVNTHTTENSADVNIIAVSQQEFANVDNVRIVVQESARKVKTFIPELQNTMALYLGNADTQFILFKPIKNNIVGIFTKLQSVISEHYAKDDQLLIGCPSPEQISVQLSSSCLVSRKISVDKFLPNTHMSP